MCPSFVIVGPDGTGKTTLADLLETQLAERGLVVTRCHYRPTFLGKKHRQEIDDPQPGGAGDRLPYGVVESVGKLLIVFLDYVIAWCGPWRRAARSGALILERGWFDQIVDPKRYRLSPRVGGLTRGLGMLLPRCDVVVFLHGDAKEIAARKDELSAEETRAQVDAWSLLLDRVGVRTVAIDTVLTPTNLAVERVLPFVETGTTVWRRIHPMPSRLGLRATGGKEALPALAIYEPTRRRARLALRVAAPALRFRLGRRVAPPYPLDSGAIGSWCADAGSVAMKSSWPGRWIVGVARGGRLENVVKISATRDERLENEARMLQLLEGRTVEFTVPHLSFTRSRESGTEVGMLAADLGDPVTSLEAAATVALELSRGVRDVGPLVHGDLAPWNLREGRDRFWLIDWEAAHFGFEPLQDLSHFVVRSGRLLDAWTPEGALRHLTAENGIGWRHLVDLDEDPRTALDLVRIYLASAEDESPYTNELRAMVR